MSKEQHEALRAQIGQSDHEPDYKALYEKAAQQYNELAEMIERRQANVVQQEHVGVVGEMPGTSGFTMACFHADKVPVGSKLYTHPAPQQKPLTDEHDRALCEAYCNAASDEYFKARPQLDSSANRRIFCAGHRKAWIEWQAAHNIGEKK